MVHNYGRSYTPSSGVCGNLEYVKMLNNDLLTVRIVTPYRSVIKGGLTSDFGINLNNQWKPMVSISDIPILGDISQGVIPVLAAFSGATQGTLESMWMTSASWAGSAIPTFPIKVTLLNYDKNVNLFNQVLELSEGLLPPDISYDLDNMGDFGGALKSVQQNLVQGTYKLGETLSKKVSELDPDSSIKNFVEESNAVNKATAVVAKGISQIGMAAPLNYGLQIDTKKESTVFKPLDHTTFSLQIGNWFRASNLLLEVGNFSFSKEVNPNGSPISVDISLNFRPYRQISFKEFAKYFHLQNLDLTTRGFKHGTGIEQENVGGQA